MLSLSPAKLLVVLIIALIVLGPEKLPEVARQLGALWGDLRRWRAKVESEVRSTFPDLPPTHEVVQGLRSPLSFLDRLADRHERETSVDEVAGPATGSGTGETGLGSAPHANGGRPPPGSGRARPGETAALAPAAPDRRSNSDSAASDGAASDGAASDARASGWVYDDPSMN